MWTRKQTAAFENPGTFESEASLSRAASLLCIRLDFIIAFSALAECWNRGSHDPAVFSLISNARSVLEWSYFQHWLSAGIEVFTGWIFVVLQHQLSTEIRGFSRSACTPLPHPPPPPDYRCDSYDCTYFLDDRAVQNPAKIEPFQTLIINPKL